MLSVSKFSGLILNAYKSVFNISENRYMFTGGHGQNTLSVYVVTSSSLLSVEILDEETDD